VNILVNEKISGRGQRARDGVNESANMCKGKTKVEVGVKLHPQFIVDDRGERKSVVLSVEEYRTLLEIVEDQLDAADLDQASAVETDFTPYSQVRGDLKAEGLL